MSHTLRSKNSDGTINETELTPEQALDLGSGRAIAYSPRDERLLVNEDGTIVHHESAIPRQREA